MVRHIRSLIAATYQQYQQALGETLPYEYQVVGWNSDRRVVHILAVEAGSATEAVHAADEWIQRAGKVRPHQWRTTPGI